MYCLSPHKLFATLSETLSVPIWGEVGPEHFGRLRNRFQKETSKKSSSSNKFQMISYVMGATGFLCNKYLNEQQTINDIRHD